MPSGLVGLLKAAKPIPSPLPHTPHLPNNLRERTAEEIASEVRTLGGTPEQARRVSRAVLRDGMGRVDDLPVAKRLRDRLSGHCVIIPSPILDRLVSKDGSEKLLLGFPDGETAETVYIPDGNRATLCVSTQAGCRSGCRFCLSGSAGWRRHLSCGEMLDQVLGAQTALGRRITNLVLMGTGEPLDNFDAVKRFVGVAADPYGLALSPRKITISTSGLIPGIRRMGKEIPVSLAVSLNAPTEELRSELMPINRQYPLADLLAALRDYAAPGRRVFIEYILFAGVNDSPEIARLLCDRLRGLPCVVNLIRFNPWPGAPFQRPDEDTVRRFQKIVLDAGFVSVVRDSRGADIMAACGQLRAGRSTCET